MSLAPASQKLALTQVNCLQCDTSKQLTCPDCPRGQECQYTVPVNTCTECPRAYCQAVSSAPTSTTQVSSSPASSSNVGPIIGGVLGGVVVIAAITYLVWRFCIKTKRKPSDHRGSLEAQEDSYGQREKGFAQRKDRRASTHTVYSLASTVLTRASNIIQIAYIPGMSNRAAPVSPTRLVPPVPPLPTAFAHSNNSVVSAGDQHYFLPSDLRDSACSVLSRDSDSPSDRTSFALRSSVASTVYGKNAVVLAPAQTGLRAKPAMVSVKSAPFGSSSANTTPPVPQVDYNKYANENTRSASPSSKVDQGTALTTKAVRAQVVRVGSVGSSARRMKVSKAKRSLSPPETKRESVISDAAFSHGGTTTDTLESPSTVQNPFSNPRSLTHSGNTALTSFEPDATSSEKAENNSLKRESSPFTDDHSIRE